jgi:hypothetical protein
VSDGDANIPIFVIPAKAGNAVTVWSIHHWCLKFTRQVVDPSLRGGDEIDLANVS